MTDTVISSTSKTIPWGRGARSSLALLLLIVLSDLLFWRVQPGISSVLFYIAIAVPIVWLGRGAVHVRAMRSAICVFILSLLPLIENVSLTGMLSGLVGTSFLALSASGRLPRVYEDLAGTFARFGALAPFRLLGDSLGFLSRGTGHGMAGRLVRIAITWIVPGVCGLGFLLLFASANPLIETALNAVRFEGALDLLQPWRIILWGLVAVVVWPLLRPQLLPWPHVTQVQRQVLPRAEGLLFGRLAILRSLILFNALFAVQTALDFVYLWGGVRLPDGLGYADYAHRGAYPLVATALLAAAFVLAAMRQNGPAQHSPLIRRLVYLWLGQNVMLVTSSILRLDLYVEAYSLTELRIAAGIWMGLVTMGLLLILARIVLGRSNKWLVTSNLIALGITLYGCSFIDFSALIARFNVENSRNLGGPGQPIDLYYLSELGPSAIPAIGLYLDRSKGLSGPSRREFELLASNLATTFLAQETDWRSWSFRSQRLKDYLRSDPRFASSHPEGLYTAPSP